jgi:hypothetical protein
MLMKKDLCDKPKSFFRNYMDKLKLLNSRKNWDIKKDPIVIVLIRNDVKIKLSIKTTMALPQKVF